MSDSKLTLGPVLFNWPNRVWRDFYARIADEAPVDRVYVGEVVCSKRERPREAALTSTIERLQRAGKTVVLSTLGLVLKPQERHRVFAMAQDWHGLVEANDVTALAALKGRPHVVGPLLNVFNETTLGVLADAGATVVCLPPELPDTAVPVIAATARERRVELELFAFGRMPLALSLRCLQAEARGRSAEGCRYLCAESPDGVAVPAVSGQPRLVLNGAQTLSGACLNRIEALPALTAAGIGAVRLSPQSRDMVTVARAFRAVLDGTLEPAAAAARLAGDAAASPARMHRRADRDTRAGAAV